VTSARRVFTLAIAAYLVAWALGFAFATRVFGPGAAAFLSVILAFPFALALRMRSRWRNLRAREFAFLFTLLLVAVAGVGRVVWDWYDTGWDRERAQDVEFVEFARLVHDDPAFRGIEVPESPKWLGMRGTVASDADLDRLRSLVARSSIRWTMEEVQVAGGSKRAEKTGSQQP